MLQAMQPYAGRKLFCNNTPFLNLKFAFGKYESWYCSFIFYIILQSYFFS